MLVSPVFFFYPKQGSTGLRGPPGLDGLEGAKVGRAMLQPFSFWALPKHCFPWLVGGRSGDLGQTQGRGSLAPRAKISKARSLPGTELGAFPFLPQGDPGPRGRDGPTGAAGLEVLVSPGLWSWELSEASPGLHNF